MTDAEIDVFEAWFGEAVELDGKIKATMSLRSIWAVSACLHIDFEKVRRQPARCPTGSSREKLLRIKAPGDCRRTLRPGFGPTAQ